MQIKGFTGFNIQPDNQLVIRELIGFSAETLENLSIRVVDNLGNLVLNATIEVTYGGVTNSYNAINGSISLYIENPISAIKINAFSDCLLGEEKVISHGGDGFNVSVEIQIGELPCLDSNNLNDYNFITWQLSNNLSFPLDLPLRECTNCDENGDSLFGLQRPTKNNECESYLPIMKNGETYSVFTNFLENYTFPNLQNIRIGLLKEGEAEPSISFPATKLSKTIVSDTFEFFYSTFTPEGLQNGMYRLCVFNNTTRQIFFISNFIKYDNNVDLQTTALVKYRNNDDIDGFQYLDLPDFYNQIRIDIFTDQAREPEPDYEDENQVATAEHRYISLAHRLSIPVVAAQLDDKACNALESMLAHNEVYINGKRYNCKPEVDYEQADETHNLYDGRFQVYDYTYARKNKYR